jgi:hypothetical protein
LFQFVVIVLHIVHYFVQCYFYIRYNYFDPQQNQIDCVETYTFAGENLALFLTHPSICFLSVLEAISIVVVWIEVALRPGGSCTSSGVFDSSNFPFQFAIFVTFVEVYKANVSTFGKLSKGGHYWWAVWSLVRIDLFVFYGFTLFLQSFFFPFSLLGHSLSGYRSEVVDGTRKEQLHGDSAPSSSSSSRAGDVFQAESQAGAEEGTSGRGGGGSSCCTSDDFDAGTDRASGGEEVHAYRPPKIKLVGTDSSRGSREW